MHYCHGHLGNFFLIIKLQLKDSLVRAVFALFKYNDWFSEKMFSMASAKFQNPFLHTNIMKKKILKFSFSNVNWVLLELAVSKTSVQLTKNLFEIGVT